MLTEMSMIYKPDIDCAIKLIHAMVAEDFKQPTAVVTNSSSKIGQHILLRITYIHPSNKRAELISALFCLLPKL